MEGEVSSDRQNGSVVDSKKDRSPDVVTNRKETGVADGAPPSRFFERGPGSDRVCVKKTEDERLLDRQTPFQPVPRAPELGAFTHTDSWRVMRIQGEFVSGIDALAEVGAAVSVFGSARFREPHPMYAEARKLGRILAETGFAVITGGGPGLMEAAN